MNNIEELSEEEIYDYAANEKDYGVYYNASNGISINTQISDFFPDKVYISIVFWNNISLRDIRKASFISLYEPEYLGRNKLDQYTKDIFIDIINSKWEEIKSVEYYKDILPDKIPDYNKLEVV